MTRPMDNLLRDTLRGSADTPTARLSRHRNRRRVRRRHDDGSRAARAEAHAAECPRCQGVLAAMVRDDAADRARMVAAAGIRVARPADRRCGSGGRLEQCSRHSKRSCPSRPCATRFRPSNLRRFSRSRQLRQPRHRHSRKIGSVADARSVAPEVLRAREAAASAKARLARATPEASANSVDARQVAAASQAQAAAPSVSRMSMSPEPARPSAFAGTDTATFRADTLARVAATLVVSSNRISQWRIGNGSEVQHSADGGSTWRTQATGVNVTLTAGSSPSPSVCWLVGPGGLVLITTDEGQSWRRVPFPVDDRPCLRPRH